MHSMEIMNIYVKLSIDFHTHTHTLADFLEQNKKVYGCRVCCVELLCRHTTEKRVRLCLSYFNINVNKFWLMLNKLNEYDFRIVDRNER